MDNDTEFTLPPNFYPPIWGDTEDPREETPPTTVQPTPPAPNLETNK